MYIKVVINGVSQYVDESRGRYIKELKERGYEPVKDKNNNIKRYSAKNIPCRGGIKRIGVEDIFR